MFAGVDWGGHRHQLAIVDDVGDLVLNERFNHDRVGIDELVAVLDHHRGGAPLPVAIERSEGLVVEALQANGRRVFPVSPRVSARARERYQAAARKDDRFDAFVLADRLRHEHLRWRPLAVPLPVLAELRVLVRDRRRTLESQQAIETQLRAALEAYHPAAARLFSSVDRAITLAFVRDYPTPEAAATIGERRMESFLVRPGYTGRVPAGLLVDRLRTTCSRRQRAAPLGTGSAPWHWLISSNCSTANSRPTTPRSPQSSTSMPTPRSSPAFHRLTAVPVTGGRCS